MEFMEKSEKPTMFPTKEELGRAGRVDLVEAIKKRGGWYSLGWEDENEKNAGKNVKEDIDFDIGEFHKRVESCKEIAAVGEKDVNSFSGDSLVENEERLSSGNPNSSQLTSSSGRSLEIGAEEDTGIKGILSRLKQQRNTDFGINLGKYGYQTHSSTTDERNGWYFRIPIDEDSPDAGKSTRFTLSIPTEGVANNSGGKITPDIQPETWRTWSIQREGFQDTEFEAAEISYSKNQVEQNKEAANTQITASTENNPEALGRHEINHNQIRTRLRHLECELNTALHSLRSKREEFVLDEVSGSSSSDLQTISDAWEFQENEYMNTQQRLRSIRAKLAVLEGKMALAIIDAHKIVEEKQESIDGVHKALQLLRTACIVWPNSASEVLLAGSFDGWTSQRKMEKSRTGIFSMCLKLYPGRYEIKFIVDGIWKVDYLRPIVHNNGYANNLLIIT
ncbi:unnamed protein product [Fraxinus pennsylvanica]|uniref:AMP-activated protein kinase glycogen-binding domain-containing protein n=1 Tax=Fraxinus pennsylvanica TaxID=56036 RepID=A0AAD2E583_9LAMI|nr:unnamed protein product [Fraxinus pennsylvanica]